MYILTNNVTRQVRTWRILAMTRSPESGPEDCLAETEPIAFNPRYVVTGSSAAELPYNLTADQSSI